MRLLVVGAGASYAEALEAGLPPEHQPPLMGNFVGRMWSEYNPHNLLSAYLIEAGYPVTGDPRDLLCELEKIPDANVNVERFFEYAYRRRHLVAPGPPGMDPGTEYDNLLLHGILNPLVFILTQGLLKNGPEQATLPLARRVAGTLRPGDVVLNLNYDTLFEIAAEQAGHTLAFLPQPVPPGSLAVSKPHGSMNLLVDLKKDRFQFSPTLFAASIQPADGSKNYLGFVPPRYRKQYNQHPVAEVIIDATKGIKPSHVIFWGVGLTDSDRDLLALFRRWSQSAATVDFINPSKRDVEKAERLLMIDVTQFEDVSAWEARGH